MSENHTYIVTLDMSDPDLELKRVRTALTADDRIAKWWNYLPGVYIVQTDLSVKDVTSRVHKHAGNTSFLVSEIDLSASNGWLPDRAWKWIRRREKERESASEKGFA